jgi:hypothetical protein
MNFNPELEIVWVGIYFCFSTNGGIIMKVYVTKKKKNPKKGKWHIAGRLCTERVTKCPAGVAKGNIFNEFFETEYKKYKCKQYKITIFFSVFVFL